jgi:hypothetical protein
MYLGRTLYIAGATYMAIHFVVGAWTCYNKFCPGDNHNDWVYEYVDDNGKKFIVENGKAVPAEQYKESK